MGRKMSIKKKIDHRVNPLFKCHPDEAKHKCINFYSWCEATPF